MSGEGGGDQATQVDPLSGSLPDGATGAPAATEPPREDQVINAVSFLTNPKVASATTEAKRSFLVRKGLTPAEIDEAFQRVPAPPAAAAFAPAALPTYSATAAQPVYTAPAQLQVAQPQQQLVAQQPLQLQPQAPPPPQGPRWTTVVLGLTAVAAGAYGVQRLVMPYVKEYYDRWAASVAARGEKSQKRQALTDAEQGAAAVLADAIKAQTEEMRATLTELKEVLAEVRKPTVATEKPPIDAAALRSELRADVRSDLRAELRSFAETISELSGAMAGTGNTPMSSAYGTPHRSPDPSPAKGHFSSHGSYGGGFQDGAVALNAVSAAADSRPAFAAPAAALKSGGSSVSGEPPKPASYEEVMEMLQAGRTPPGIRTDIRDTPPDAAAPPSASRIPPRPKPWERKPLAETQGATANGAPPSGGSTWQASGRAASVASSIAGSDAGGEEAAPWRPPPMPQPSMPLPRRRSVTPPPASPNPQARAPNIFPNMMPQQAASMAPVPKASTGADAAAVAGSTEQPAADVSHSNAPAGERTAVQNTGSGGDAGREAAVEFAPESASVSEITPADDQGGEASQGVEAGEDIYI